MSGSTSNACPLCRQGFATKEALTNHVGQCAPGSSGSSDGSALRRISMSFGSLIEGEAGEADRGRGRGEAIDVVKGGTATMGRGRGSRLGGVAATDDEIRNALFMMTTKLAEAEGRAQRLEAQAAAEKGSNVLGSVLKAGLEASLVGVEKIVTDMRLRLASAAGAVSEGDSAQRVVELEEALRNSNIQIEYWRGECEVLKAQKQGELEKSQVALRDLKFHLETSSAQRMEVQQVHQQLSEAHATISQLRGYSSDMERHAQALQAKLDKQGPAKGNELQDTRDKLGDANQQIFALQEEVSALKLKLAEATKLAALVPGLQKRIDEFSSALPPTVATPAPVSSATSIPTPKTVVGMALSSSSSSSSIGGVVVASPPPGSTLKRVRDRMGEGRFSTFVKCLFVIKGKARVRAVAVEVSPQSITKGDVYVLETESSLMTYVGEGASKHKIAKGVDIVKKIQRKRGAAKPTAILTFDPADGTDCTPFWRELGDATPASLPEPRPDGEWEEDVVANSSMYLCASDGTMSLVEVKLVREILQSDACYIFDSPSEIYVWQGKKTDAKHRNDALVRAQHLLEDPGNRPEWLFVQRMTEGAENALFEDKFVNWPDQMQKIIGKVAHGGVSTKTTQVLPRILEMLEGVAPRELEPVTEAGGSLEVCAVTKDMKRNPFAPFPNGVFVFLETECYLICYTAPSNARVYWYWIGQNASQTLQGITSSLAKQWLDETGMGGNLVRVEQGREPPHFLSSFGGCMVVVGSRDTSTRMVHVRGTDSSNTRSIQCPMRAIYLHSDDCFVVANDLANYVWTGSSSSAHCGEVAIKVATALHGSMAAAKVCEFAEPMDFWTALSCPSGASPHASHLALPKPVRFWVCANVNKTLSAVLQSCCTQVALSHATMAMMDLSSTVYLWFGCDVSLEDKILLAEVALDYVAKAQRKECPVWTMDEGDEVVEFTSHFQAWNPSLLATRRKNVEIGDPVFANARSLLRAQGLIEKRGKKYSLRSLSNKDFLPDGVDPKELERFLRDDDFPLVFGVEAAAFWALPQWKRTELKKGSALF